MKHLYRSLAVASLVAGLGACAAIVPVPGQTESEVVQQMGKPTHVYPDGAGHLLEYMHGRMGQTTYLARIAADGKLVSYEQVLTSQVFGTIKIGEADKDKVLRTIG